MCVAAGGGVVVIKAESEALLNAFAGVEPGDEGEESLHERELAREDCGEVTVNFVNPAQPPGPGWEWRGNPDSPVGSDEGAWYNPETKESLHPDLEHPEPIGPHYDYKAPNGSEYRIYPDGRIEPKP
jgi:hypothetical protein